MNADARTGRVIANHGRHVTVETAADERVFCKVSGRKLEVVCGDEVTVETDGSGGCVVTARLPRRSALARTDAVGRAETVVANLTQLIVVLAPKPEPDFFVIDRYLAAAQLLEISALLLLNKADMEGEGLEDCRKELKIFEQMGYSVLECSAAQDIGIDALRQCLLQHTTLLVGQSGAGKSSLANRLLPGLKAATSELVRNTAEGKHTTTVSTLHHVPSGGDLIDSPGVRDFAPAIEWLHDPSYGFREFKPLLGSCRFQDCRHLREPGCAIINAVESGAIAARRYESYRRLARLKDDLTPKPGQKPK